MKRTQTHVTSTFIAAMLLLAVVSAGNAQGYGCGGYGNTYFDETTITTLTGTIDDSIGDWEVWGHGNHTGGGMGYLFIAADGEEFDLMLAPWWYLDENGIDLSDGDTVTIKGSIVEDYYDDGRGGGYGRGGGGRHGGGRHGGNSDNDFIVAISITVNGKTLELRDERGYPLWSGGFGGGGLFFDVETVETIRGTFSENLGFWSAWGHGNHTGNGMHMLFTTNKEKQYYAMLGPWWYLQDQGIVIEEGTEARITGSVVKPYFDDYDDHDFIIATEIRVDGKTVKLRDENGVPLWGGHGWHYAAPTYDRSARDNVTGTVRKVRTRTRAEHADPGLEIVMKNEDGKFIVFVSPQWYADMIDMDIKRGDEIRVRGSLTQVRNNRWELVAQKIRTSGPNYRLRTNDGTPRWISGAK